MVADGVAAMDQGGSGTNQRFSRLVSLLWVAMVVLCQPVAAAPLYAPKPIAVPEGRTLDEVRHAIRAAVSGDTIWSVLDDKPSQMLVMLAISMHTARLSIDYDLHSVRFTYLSSQELDYKQKPDGRQTIHRNYNKWLRELVRNIQTHLHRPPPEQVVQSAYRESQTVLTSPLSAFSKFELSALEISPAYREHSANKSAATTLQSSITHRIQPLLDQWNAVGGGDGRTLLITPYLQAIRFLGMDPRLLAPRAGGGAQNAGIELRVQAVDAATGEVVADRLIERSREAASQWSYSVADYKMLEAAVADMKAFLADSYSAQAPVH